MKLVDNSKWILVIGIACILLKIFIIDIDLPNYRIASYQPLDEIYYVTKAMNLYKTGSLDNFDKPGIMASPIITNVFTYFTLLVFGNNYTGLRFSSILFALISVCFFYLTLKKVTKNNLFLLAGILLLVFNYPFTLSNIVVEPTIARMAAALTSLYLLMLWAEKNRDTFLSIFTLTTICVLLWLFTYPTNAFVVLALTIVVFFAGNVSYKVRIKRTIPISVGILFSILIFYVFCLFFGNNFYDTFLAGHDGKVGFILTEYGDRVGFSIGKIFTNCFYIFKANIFRFNPLLLFLFILSTLVVLKSKWKNFLNKDEMIPWIFYSCFILQTFFINDTPQRKLIFLLPFVIFVVIQFFETTNENKKRSISNVILTIVSLLILTSVALGQKYFTMAINKELLFLSVIGLICVCWYFFIKKHTIPIISIFAILLLTESYNTYRFSLKNVTKHYKETFIYLDKLKNKKFIGGFSMGFVLYNTNTAYFNFYNYAGHHQNKSLRDKIEKMAIESSEIDYMIGYEPDSLDILNPRFEKKEILMPVEITVSSGVIVNRNVILYVEKDN